MHVPKYVKGMVHVCTCNCYHQLQHVCPTLKILILKYAEQPYLAGTYKQVPDIRNKFYGHIYYFFISLSRINIRFSHSQNRTRGCRPPSQVLLVLTHFERSHFGRKIKCLQDRFDLHINSIFFNKMCK